MVAFSSLSHVTPDATRHDTLYDARTHVHGTGDVTLSLAIQVPPSDVGNDTFCKSGVKSALRPMVRPARHFVGMCTCGWQAIANLTTFRDRIGPIIAYGAFE